MKVRELLDFLGRQDPEAEVITRQSYDDSFDIVRYVRVIEATRTVRIVGVGTVGSVGWTNVPPQDVDREYFTAEGLRPILLE